MFIDQGLFVFDIPKIVPQPLHQDILLRHEHLCDHVHSRMYLPLYFPVSIDNTTYESKSKKHRCTPIRGYWDINIKQNCINMRVELVIIAALNSFSDFVIYL